MFLCVLLLALVNTSSGNRYAADAIQFAIFGDVSTGTTPASPGNPTEAQNADTVPQEADSDEAGDSETVSATEADSVTEADLVIYAAEAETDSVSSSMTNAATEAAQHMMTSKTAGSPSYHTTKAHTTAATTPAAATAAAATAAAATAAHSHASHSHATGHGRHYTGGGGWSSSRRRSSAALSRRRTTTPSSRRSSTTTPPRQNQGRKKTFSGKSYSFKQLSGMSANSAPTHKGNFYMPEEYERIPRVEPCQAVKCHLSMVIVMDSSGSVGATDYQKELSFVRTLLEILAVKAVDSKLELCVGLVSYSTDVHVEVDPCCENSICRIVDQFHARRLEYRAGSTNTNGALKVARQMLQAAASHKKVALLITDGKSNTGGSPVPFAKRMRDQDGIQIVALGVTNDVNRAELKGVSGMDRVTKIDVFDEFHELASILLQANKVASKYELETSFDAMCYNDKSYYKKDQCTRVMTEEQKSQCVWGEWSNCVRRGARCSKTRTCKLSGIVIMREDDACKCPPCEPGKYLNVADQHCYLCGANTYSDAGASVCISCPTDKMSDPGSTSSSDCVREFEVMDADGNIVTGEQEGLLLYKGGTVCDDYFDDIAANAICREMGRPYGEATWKNGNHYSYQSRKTIKIDDVKCHSYEWDSCTFRIGHNCAHTEDVHIACKGNKGRKPSKPTKSTKPTTQKTDEGSDTPSETTVHYHHHRTTQAPGQSVTA